MNTFEKKIQQFPETVRHAWSIGFVFMYNGKNFQHFPARQWTDAQIKAYFKENYDCSSNVIPHPEFKLKEVQVDGHPTWIVIVPY